MYKIGLLLTGIFLFLNFKLVTAQQLIPAKILLQKVEMLMPSDFRQMDISTIKVKYPNEGGRPGEVYTNNNSSVNLAFTHTAKKVSAADIKSHADELIALLKQKGIVVLNQRQEKINGKDFLIVDFNSKTINGSLYNKMFFTALAGRLLIGNYSCTSSIAGQWKSKGDEMIKSIKLLQ
jgi:hypothetical protein